MINFVEYMRYEYYSTLPNDRRLALDRSLIVEIYNIFMKWSETYRIHDFPLQWLNGWASTNVDEAVEYREMATRLDTKCDLSNCHNIFNDLSGHSTTTYMNIGLDSYLLSLYFYNNLDIITIERILEFVNDENNILDPGCDRINLKTFNTFGEYIIQFIFKAVVEFFRNDIVELRVTYMGSLRDIIYSTVRSILNDVVTNCIRDSQDYNWNIFSETVVLDYKKVRYQALSSLSRYHNWIIKEYDIVRFDPPIDSTNYRTYVMSIIPQNLTFNSIKYTEQYKQKINEIGVEMSSLIRGVMRINDISYDDAYYLYQTYRDDELRLFCRSIGLSDLVIEDDDYTLYRYFILDKMRERAIVGNCRIFACVLGVIE